jgi:hypothetical protein
VDWQLAYRWARNLFAIVGVLGTLLVSALVGYAMTMEAQYERRAADAAKVPPVSLETAAVLMANAGIRRQGGEQLLGGVNAPWNEGSMLEAYCVQAEVNRVDRGWTRAGALDPYLRRAAGVVLDFAHAKLHCIPDAQRLRDPDTEIKLISLEVDGEGIVQSRLALREPASGRYYLVSALRPGPVKAAGATTTAPVPSTD